VIEHEGIFYLELEDALDVYAELFEMSPLEARDHLRSQTGLEGALDRPLNYTYYAPDADIALLAAVLVHGIAETQPFLDGNKRTAYFACLNFLDANGYALDASQGQVAEWIEQLSDRSLDAEGLVERLRMILTDEA
jgi:death-on-curing protein